MSRVEAGRGSGGLAERDHEARACATIRGFEAATFNSACAGPTGLRRPCSQF